MVKSGWGRVLAGRRWDGGSQNSESVPAGRRPECGALNSEARMMMGGFLRGEDGSGVRSSEIGRAHV